MVNRAKILKYCTCYENIKICTNLQDILLFLTNSEHIFFPILSLFATLISVSCETKASMMNSHIKIFGSSKDYFCQDRMGILQYFVKIIAKIFYHE